MTPNKWQRLKLLLTGIVLAVALVVFSVDLVRAVPGIRSPEIAPSAQGDTPPPNPIEVAKSDELVDDADSNGQASPGDTIEYTVVITNNGSSDVSGLVFSDTLDANTILTGVVDVYPVAVTDVYEVLGNTGISIGSSSGLLTNDFDPDSGSLSVQDVTDALTVEGGTISISTDGSFTYDPPVGFTGTDSFTYVLQDSDGLQSLGTVTFTISQMIWYVDDGATAGDGRYSSPASSLSFVESASGAGDIIYLFSGSYSEDITLKNNQMLIGQGVLLSSAAGITYPEGSSEPAIGSPPTINGSVVAGSDNTIRGLNINTGSGDGLSGSSFGTLTLSDVTISGSDRALSLNSGTLDATFDAISSSGSSSNGIALTAVEGTATINGGSISAATGSALVIDGGNANITYSGSINNGTGRSVEIINRSGGTVTLSGNIDDTGSGIFLQNNGGGSINFSGASKVLDTGSNTAVSLLSNSGASITFSNGGLEISTTSATGLNASGGGSLAITGAGNSVSSSGARAVSISDVTIAGGGITLESVVASSSDRGIRLNNAGSGGFTVTGTGTTAGSGGTIQNITLRGIEIVNTDNVSFSNVNLISANTLDGGGAGVCDTLNTSSCNAAIYLNGVSGAAFNNVDISGTIVEQGINGISVSIFVFDDGAISNCGNAVGEGCIKMRNLTGNASISGSDISFAHEKNVEIHNDSGTLTLTANNSTFRDTQSSAEGADGLEIVADNSANVTVSVSGSQFLRNRTVGFAATALNSSDVDVDLIGSTFDAEAGVGRAVNLEAISSSTLTFEVLNNPTVHSNGGSAINVAAFDNATIEGHISGNADIQLGGPGTSGNGISVQVNDNASGALVVESNDISNIGWDNGIAVISRPDLLATPSGSLDLAIRNNTVDLASVDNLYGINVTAVGSNTTCAYVTGNTVSGSGGVAGFRTRESSGGTVYLQGFAGSTAATWSANGNSGTVSESPFGSTSAPPTGSCATPSLVQMPSDEMVQAHSEPIVFSGTRPLLTPYHRDQFTQQTGTSATHTAARHVPGGTMALVSPFAPQPLARLAVAPPAQSTPDVEVGPFTLPAGHSAKIVFRVTIDRPFPAGPPEISNQASVSSDDYATVLSDDPQTTEPADATVTELLVEADLAISKSDGATELVSGKPVTYTIVATNNGPDHVGGATVSDSFPAGLTAISWTCEAGPGAACAASGSGDIDEDVQLNAGSAITFTVSALIDAGAVGTLDNSASVATPSGLFDPQMANNSASDSTTLTPQADLTLQKSESADPVVAGSGNGNLTYVVTLTNNGPSDASNITVTEVITRPTGVTLDSVTHNSLNSTYSDGEWIVSDLDVGQSEQLTVTLTARSNAKAGSNVVGDTATVTGADQVVINSADDQVTEMSSITRQVDLQLSMTESSDPVTAGSGPGNLSYVVTVQNNGPSIASGVTVTDVLSLPAGVTTESITPSGSTSWDGGTDTWTIGTLPSGSNATLTILLTAGPDAAAATDAISNEAALLAVAEGDTDSGNNSAAHSTSVNTEADLVLQKSDEPDPAVAGEVLTYTVAVTNNGPSTAHNVVVDDTLTEDVTLLQSEGCVEDPYGAPTCSLGTVGAGQTVSYTLQVMVDSTASNALSNSATVTSNTPEAFPGNESDTETTAVNQVADLQIAVSDNPDPAIAGGPLTYTVAITNSGPSVAPDVVVADSLPAAFTYSGDSCGGTLSGTDWSWNAGAMAIGARQSCAISGTISAGFSGTLSNTPYVTGGTLDPNPTDNVITETTTVFDNRFSIGDTIVTEGDSGTATVTFTITRTTNANASSVDVQTVDAPGGGAIAGEDYTALALTTLDFTQGGALTQTITVDVHGDSLVELDETFLVALSNPVDGGIEDGEGVGTISNDDSATISIAGESREEGDSGATTYVFTATLSADVDSSVDVDYSTVDDSATSASGDYAAASGTLNFSGTAGEEETFTVTVNGDTTVELDEQFLVELGNLSTAGRDVTMAGSGEAQGEILNDDSATLSIQDVDRQEGDSGTTTYVFTTTLSAAVDSAFSVDYATVNATATTVDNDFNTASGTVNFSGTAGEERTISVVVAGDTTVELDETFLLNLSNLSAAGRDVTLADGQAVGAIGNDDSASLAIVDSSHSEGDSGTTNHVFTVTLSADVDTGVTVNYATADATAEDESGGGDYTATSDTLAFSGAAGEEQTITVAAHGDTVVELDEVFAVQLSNVAADGREVTLAGDGQGEGALLNDDSAELDIVDVSQAEGDSGTTGYVFTVTLSADVDTGVTVDYGTADGTAEDENGDADYAAASGTLSFTGKAGEEQTITVDVTGETRYEPDEQFYLDLSNVSAAGRQVTIADDQAQGEVINDDGPPSITIDDNVVDEGVGTAVFTVTLSNASSQPVSVEYGTADGTATSADSDYTAVPTNTLTIPAGNLTGNINVGINDDANHEADETFVINLAELPAVVATLADDQATGTIVDNDAPPTLSVDDITVDETDGTAIFTVTLDATSGLDVSAGYATNSGTATSGADYVAANGMISIPAGAISDTVTVSLIDDALDEMDETFTVDLSNPTNADIDDGQGLATVLDDDPTPSLSIAGVTVDESAGTALFQVSLSAPSGLDVSVAYETGDGTAIGGQDYDPISNTLTIAAGGVTGTISVLLTADDVDENDETFTVDLTNSTNATIDVAQATGVITDDDTAVVDFAHAASAANENSSAVPITVTLSIPAAFTVTVDYASSDGTALASSDYGPISGTLRFAPGVTALSFDLPILQDSLDEAGETIMLTLSNASQATLGADNNPAAVTIVDDDGEPTVNFSDFNYVAVESGGSATISVTLSHLSGLDVSVGYASADGSAEAGADYDAVSGTVTIPAGELSTTFTVPIADDTLHENDETVTVTLSNPANATIGAVNPATLTVVDDDPMPEIQFQASEFSEVEGTSARITVTLGAVSGLDASVAYASSDGTATAESDYTAITGTLTIPAGLTQATFTVPLAADGEDEADETIELALSAANNAKLGEPHRATLTIEDNNFTVYMPVSMNNVTYAPDLVVSSLTAEGSSIQLRIENQGNEPVVDAFWVDLYIDPRQAPQGVNDTWFTVGEYGAVWGVEETLAPGEALTLTVHDSNYHAMLSNLPPSLAAGTALYAQVDSASVNSSYGGVVEKHEISGAAYNNIIGPVVTSQTIPVPGIAQPGNSRSLFAFPARPRAK